MNAQLVSESVKKTPLYKCHEKLGAKFTEFGGWLMPVQYSGVIDEHVTVRTAAGLFDVSHMGEIIVSGPKAFEFLQYLTSNDISRLHPGEAQYSLLVNPRGGVVDDIIVYMFDSEKYLLCVNAGNADKDWQWIQDANTFGAILENMSSEYGQIALQGPKAREIMAKYLGVPPNTVSFKEFRPFTFRIHKQVVPGKGSEDLIIACTGYTGEDGFEIFCPASSTAAIWESLLEVGAPLGLKPAGLGARDSLRLEACYPLHGHELSEDINALNSGVGWVVKFEKGNFIGRDALLKEKNEGLKLKLVGLEVLDRGIVREGAKLFSPQGGEIGWSTSGTKPPTVNKSIAMGFVPPEFSSVGTKLTADVRGKMLNVQVIKKPFYKRETAEM